MAYSTGGAMLAASSGPLVVVYATYSMEPLLTLSAHMGAVRQIAWSRDDLHLFTVGEDGASGSVFGCLRGGIYFTPICCRLFDLNRCSV